MTPVPPRRRWCSGLALLLLLQAPASFAAMLEGRVVHVTDGDSLTVLDDNRRQHKIRLAGIDAPERRQAWGQRATERLAELAKHRHVTVEWRKTDRYRRVIGIVRVAPSDCPQCRPEVDVGLVLVGDGYAWHYRAYEGEQSPEHRRQYRDAEAAARARQAGLWTDAHPTAPWDWRRARRARVAANR